jgi:hypothetical protein
LIAAALVAWLVVPTGAAVADSILKSNYRVYRSAYFLGRGDTGIATADNEEAIFYNPAGLAYGNGIYKKVVLVSPQVEVSEATKDLTRQLSVEDADAVDTVRQHVGKPNHFGFNNFTGLILRRVAIGVVASGNVDLIAYKSPDTGGLEVIDAAAEENTGFTFSLADGFFSNKLLLGVTTKYLSRGRGEMSVSLAEADKAEETLAEPSDFLGMGTGTGADVGMMLRGGGRLSPSFGLTVSDVGDTAIVPEEETAVDLDLKQTINAGVAIEPGTKYSKLRFLLDYRDIASHTESNWRKKLYLGSEISVRDFVGVTGGLHQGYPSFGFYTDLYFLRLDVGMYTEEVGERAGTRPDSRYFARIKAGF